MTRPVASCRRNRRPARRPRFAGKPGRHAQTPVKEVDALAGPITFARPPRRPARWGGTDIALDKGVEVADARVVRLRRRLQQLPQRRQPIAPAAAAHHLAKSAPQRLGHFFFGCGSVAPPPPPPPPALTPPPALCALCDRGLLRPFFLGNRTESETEHPRTPGRRREARPTSSRFSINSRARDSQDTPPAPSTHLGYRKARYSWPGHGWLLELSAMPPKKQGPSNKTEAKQKAKIIEDKAGADRALGPVRAHGPAEPVQPRLAAGDPRASSVTHTHAHRPLDSRTRTRARRWPSL